MRPLFTFAFDLFTCSSHFSNTNRRVQLRSVAVHVFGIKDVAQFVAGEAVGPRKVHAHTVSSECAKRIH
jgi:hypothetical protein